ncbi:hypothetical protein WA026_014755 [Henosepilachna vigintioctopunctata]|uniref:EF-hand domain-containing protein n=1 Tax=Henosepilachna vigintioctopunctata TaxID=420089 RepID=A0AAW1V8M6_9CUCU
MSQEQLEVTEEGSKEMEEVSNVEVEREETIGENNKRKAETIFKQILEIPKISSTELIRKVMTREPLFKSIYTSDSFTDLLPKKSSDKMDSILVSGFGLKSLQQLQDALKFEIESKSRKTEAEMFPCVCSDESSDKSESIPSPVPLKYSIEDRMKYLLQLEQYIEVEGEYGIAPPPKVSDRQLMPGFGEPTQRSGISGAKEYLKEHKIFQFFQFLVSHLLSAVPDPIEYLMALLDRILLYRGGLLSPPVLYEKKHIEQLFLLMDRFGQGTVDFQQYKTAMETLGISKYNTKPLMNQFNMISKEIFIEEIYNAELAMFNELIKNRVPCICDPTAPPPTIIDLDLKSQTTATSLTSVDTNDFHPVASVPKFWVKHGEKQPKVYKGKFWAEFKQQKQRKDKQRDDVEKKISEVTQETPQQIDVESTDLTEEMNSETN